MLEARNLIRRATVEPGAWRRRVHVQAHAHSRGCVRDGAAGDPASMACGGCRPDRAGGRGLDRDDRVAPRASLARGWGARQGDPAPAQRRERRPTVAGRREAAVDLIPRRSSWRKPTSNVGRSGSSGGSRCSSSTTSSARARSCALLPELAGKDRLEGAARPGRATHWLELDLDADRRGGRRARDGARGPRSDTGHARAPEPGVRHGGRDGQDARPR